MAFTEEMQKEIVSLIKSEIDVSTAETIKDSYKASIERLAKAAEQPAMVQTDTQRAAKARTDAGVLFASLAQAGGNKEKAIGIANKAGSAVAEKALSESVAADGGLLIAETVAPDVAAFLRAKSVVRGSGLRQINLPDGSFRLNRGASGVSISWVNELAKVNASKPSLAAVEMNAKKGMIIVPISSELAADAKNSAGFVADEMQMAMGQGEDIAFLLGSGASGVPKGMSVWAANTVTAVASSSAATFAEIVLDCKKTLTKFSDQNLGVSDPAWYMSERSRIAAMLADASGLFPLIAEVSRGSLFGIPLYETNNLPNNLGGGTESEILLADRSKVFIGDKGGIIMETFPAGTYNDSSGTMRSGISTDEIVLRAKLHVDLAARHGGTEIVKLDTVKWI